VVTVHRYLNRPTDYERRVLERIMVPAGVRPLTLRDLSRRHTEDNSDWDGRLAREVRADAVQRGLIRPGHESPAVNVIIVGYLLPFMLSCLGQRSRQPVRGRRGGSRRTADGVGVVHAYFVVLDDGRADAVRAWWATPDQAPRFRPGTTVTATVEPWSACVVAVDTVAAERVA
jgi:hypothetical protein